MSIVIEIVSTQINTRNGVSSKNGKPYSINEQVAFVHKVAGEYPDRIKINLENGQPPYAPGNYDLSPQSYFVDRFDSLAVRPILIPRAAENRQSPSTEMPLGIKKN